MIVTEEVKPKVKLVEVRDIGKNIEKVLEFLKACFGPIFVGIAPFLLIAIVSGIMMPSNIEGLLSNINQYIANGDILEWYSMVFTPQLIASKLMAGLMSISIMLYLICYMKLYNDSADGNVKTSEVYTKMMSVFFQFIGGQIVLTFILLIGFMLCIIPGIYLSIALTFYFHAYVNEENVGLMQGISRSNELVKTNWWETFGLMFIVSIVVSIAQSVIGAILGLAIGAMSGIIGSEITFTIIQSLSNIIAGVFSIITYSAMGVCYYHLYAKKEGVDTFDEINNIGTDY